MKKYWIILMVLASILLLTSCTAVEPVPSPTPTPTTAPTPEIISTQAMIIIGNEFGNTYFDMKMELENQGFDIVTVGVGTSELMSSCPNHENVPVTPDMNIVDITSDNIEEFALVFIPAGKHHRSLQFSAETARVLNLCKENSVYISSVCAGNIVLASVENLIEGIKIASSSLTKEYIQSAGGICRYTPVVVDGLFVTGSSGGGKTGSGHDGAPTAQLAVELKALIIGQ